MIQETIANSFNFARRTESFLKIIPQSKNMSQFIDHIRDNFDIDHVTWCKINSSETHCFSTYPAEWLHIYSKHNYEQHDIVLQSAKNSLTLFIWNQYSVQNSCPKQKDVLHHAAEYGLKSGVTLSMNLQKKTIVTFTSNISNKNFQKYIHRYASDIFTLSYILSIVIESLQQGEVEDVALFAAYEALDHLMAQQEKNMLDIKTAIQYVDFCLLDT